MLGRRAYHPDGPPSPLVHPQPHGIAMRLLPAALGVLLLATLMTSAEDWPAWRGPGGQGHSSEKGLPVKWSATENVRWKVPLPAPGNSTPIVHGERIFHTQAT